MKERKKKKHWFSNFISDSIRIVGVPGLVLTFWPKYHYAPGIKSRRIKGRAVVACNHTSYYEGLLMYMIRSSRRVRSLTTKEAVTAKNFFGWTLRRLNSIAINRDMADIGAFRKVVDALKEEELVTVMPEGRISCSGRMDSFKPGVFLMALRGDAPVYPTYIGHPKAFRVTHIYVGKPISPAEVRDETARTGEKPVDALLRMTYEVLSGFEDDYYALLAKQEARKKRRWEYVEAKPGDRIRVKRAEGYYHYGIYASDDEVIHFSGEHGDGVMNREDFAPLPNTAQSPSEVISVRSDPIERFLADGNLEVRVCTRREKSGMFQAEEVVARARKEIGKTGYHAVKNNCEHFVNFCTTGFKTSTTDILTGTTNKAQS